MTKPCRPCRSCKRSTAAAASGFTPTGPEMVECPLHGSHRRLSDSCNSRGRRHGFGSTRDWLQVRRATWPARFLGHPRHTSGRLAIEAITSQPANQQISHQPTSQPANQPTSQSGRQVRLMLRQRPQGVRRSARATALLVACAAGLLHTGSRSSAALYRYNVLSSPGGKFTASSSVTQRRFVSLGSQSCCRRGPGCRR